jgi:DHA1 family bicyclomycin/chloramphenicol resistance-like MFS transporter
LIAASQLNRWLLRKWNLYRVLRGALTTHVIAALLFLAAAVLHAPMILMCVPLWVMLASLGITSPNGTAASLSGEARIVFRGELGEFSNTTS